jgi:hypothetical protein
MEMSLLLPMEPWEPLHQNCIFFKDIFKQPIKMRVTLILRQMHMPLMHTMVHTLLPQSLASRTQALFFPWEIKAFTSP